MLDKFNTNTTLLLCLQLFGFNVLILGTLLPLTCDAAGLAEVSVVNADGYRIDDADITASSQYNEVNCASVMARDLYAADGWKTWCSGMTLVSD